MTTTLPHVPTTHARFVPFETMTPAEQAEHLVRVHGMGADYWDGNDGDGTPLPDDSAVTAWFLSAWWTENASRTNLHTADHEYLVAEADPGILACEHTHDKPAPAADTVAGR